MKFLSVTVLATLVTFAGSIPAERALASVKDRGGRKHGRPTSIRVRRPTVVVFVPENWKTNAKTDAGTSEMVAHVSFAVGDVKRCKAATPIDIRMVFADRLDLDIGGRHDKIDLASRFPDSAGAVLVKPGTKACAIATPKDTAFLGTLLSHAVGKFFDVPTCLQQGMSDDPCSVGGG